jgi:hypothetical protein
MPESAMPATARLALRMSAAVMEMSATASLGSAVEAVHQKWMPARGQKSGPEAFIHGFGGAEASGNVVELSRPA